MTETEQVVSHIIESRDPRLDWSPQHDRRSIQYAVSDVIPYQEPREKFWKPGAVLDQGQEGACVGFGWTGEAICSPYPDPDTTSVIGNTYARGFYNRCKQIDEWPGENYDGTSVLAGAKVAVERGLIDSYLWCFTLQDIRDRLMAPASIGGGPVVIGVPWYEEMYDTAEGGFVNTGGELVGGHCLFLNGYRPHMRFHFSGVGYVTYTDCFRWMNSWGQSYGNNGHGWITGAKLQALLDEWGEACAPMGRNTVRLSDPTFYIGDETAGQTPTGVEKPQDAL
jgi:hypothetical protein